MAKKSNKYEEEKLKALGLFKAGYNAKEISRELGVPYPKVRDWKVDAEKISSQADLEAILDVDTVVLHELADTVRDKFEELAEGSGEIVTQVIEKVDNLQALQVDLQNSGVLLVERVNDLICECKNPNDLLTLVEAIARLQTAFFAKGANVNVLNVPGSPDGPRSDSGISAYKSMMRSA